MNSAPQLSLQEFFFNVPLYTPILFDDSNYTLFSNICDTNEIIEGYNPFKKVNSTFKNITNMRKTVSFQNFWIDGGFRTISLVCKRYDQLFLFYIYFEKEKSILTKVGQYPSVADLHINEIKKYNKLLGPDKQREFTRAMGLAANGVGIGSFVYLRRIFEFLISNAKDEGINAGEIKEESFIKLRMDEKINTLKKYLPDFLVENRKMYLILSKGIHELEEDECLQYFDTLRVGIEIILDEKLEELKKKSKIAEAKKKISAILGKEKS